MKVKKNFLLAAQVFVLAVFSLLITVGSPNTQATRPDELSNWTNEASLPDGRTEMGTVEYNGYVYLVGGAGPGQSDATLYAKINSNGSIASWATSPNNLPTGNFRLTAVAFNGYLYAIGGRNGPALDTVYRAEINSETGEPGAWTLESTTLPVPLYYASSFVYQGYIYLVGGNDNSSGYNTVYIAPIGPDHAVGTWVQGSDLPNEIELGTTVVHDDYVYLLGGRDDDGVVSTVYYAALGSDGALGTWGTADNDLPQPLWGASSTVIGDRIYTFGGNNGEGRIDNVYSTVINAPGDTETWVQHTSLPSVTELSGAFTYNGETYVLGGNNASSFSSAVYSTVTPPEFDTGAGDPGDPFIITNCEQLQGMNFDLGASYRLGGDVDCSDTVNWNGGKGFDPVGDDEDPFTGTFDGDEYAVNDLYIQRADELNYQTEDDESYVGLFGYADGADFTEVGINGHIKGWHYVGALVGYASDSHIDGVSVNYGVETNDCEPEDHCVWARWGQYGGGVVGLADDTYIEGAHTFGPVKGSGNTIGGIVGQLENSSTLIDSDSASHVDGGWNIGGAVGYVSDSTISDVHTSGDVQVVYDDNVKLGNYGGGIAGYATGSTIEDSSATGPITGNAYIGGFIGWAQDNSEIVNSFSTGDVTASYYEVGGFAGGVYETVVSNSYATGDATTSSGWEVGGFAGAIVVSDVSGSYATGDASADENGSVGGFAGFSGCGSVISNSYATGDATGTAGIGGFSGLDGCEGPGSTFYNVYATGDATGSDSHVGGLIGQSYYSNITQAYATGDVSGLDNVGGLTGTTLGYVDGIDYSGYIQDSYATGNVTASGSQAGGLIGYMNGAFISDSYARGNVSGNDDVGGLIGTVLGENVWIRKSYSTGNLQIGEGTDIGGLVGVYDVNTENATIDSVYWDVETSGQSTSPIGQGKTTAEMIDGETYVGFNFEDVWWISADNNSGYPCLLWSDDSCSPYVADPDSDGDGIADSVEDAGPNHGDANNDEVPDSEQPNVITYMNHVSGHYAVLETNCASIEGFQIGSEAGGDGADGAYRYPFGLVGFHIICEGQGETAQIRQYYYGVEGSDQYTVRKWRGGNNYQQIPAQNMGTPIDGEVVFLVEYSIIDGGEFDDDGLANGVVVDPSGAALRDNTQSGSQSSGGSPLAGTGDSTLFVILLGFGLMLGAIAMRRSVTVER